jgi:hypothetical protein
MAASGLSLNMVSDAGTLCYDSDACKTLGSMGKNVTMSMTKDDVSVLNDAQAATIGGATFVSVVAFAGDEIISDLKGTAYITFYFGNEENWQKYAAYYIDDNGQKHDTVWSYDSGEKLVTVYATHQSVYAVLEIPQSADGSVWLYVIFGVVLVLVVVGAFYLYRMKNAS